MTRKERWHFVSLDVLDCRSVHSGCLSLPKSKGKGRQLLALDASSASNRFSLVAWEADRHFNLLRRWRKGVVKICLLECSGGIWWAFSLAVAVAPSNALSILQMPGVDFSCPVTALGVQCGDLVTFGWDVLNVRASRVTRFTKKRERMLRSKYLERCPNKPSQAALKFFIPKRHSKAYTFRLINYSRPCYAFSPLNYVSEQRQILLSEQMQYLVRRKGAFSVLINTRKSHKRSNKIPNSDILYTGSGRIALFWHIRRTGLPSWTTWILHIPS